MRFVTPVFVGAVMLAAGVLAAPAPARADGYVAPWFGGNFGGDSDSRLAGITEDASPITFGVAAGVMGGGILGIEGDVGYAPNFYGKGGPWESSRLLSAMMSLVLGAPIGGQQGPGVRPYATAGLGLIRREIDAVTDLADSSENSLGYNLGAGLMGYFSDRVGVRAEYRYLRNLQRTDESVFGFEPGHFSYSRASLGLVLRF